VHQNLRLSVWLKKNKVRHILSFRLGYMECVEDEIFRSKCSGVNTTSKLNIFFFLFI
jgi:hypothetical protein